MLSQSVSLYLSSQTLTQSGNGTRIVIGVIYEGKLWVPELCPLATKRSGRTPLLYEGGRASPEERSLLVRATLPVGTYVVRWTHIVSRYIVHPAHPALFRVDAQGILAEVKDAEVQVEADGSVRFMSGPLTGKLSWAGICPVCPRKKAPLQLMLK